MSSPDQPPIKGQPRSDEASITPRSRAAISNRPEARLDGRSAAGKRVRDLYAALLKRLGDPVGDIVLQGAVLALAELLTMAEAARLRVLEGKDQSSNECVRLENLVRRAEARVGLAPGSADRPPETLEEYWARVSANDGADDDLEHGGGLATDKDTP
jgi:hypothetical protein